MELSGSDKSPLETGQSDLVTDDKASQSSLLNTRHLADALGQSFGKKAPGLSIEAEGLAAKVCGYDPKASKDQLIDAYEYASYQHREQKRRSGEPYINHPVSVANNLADMGLDHQSVITALLHDVVEDTDATLEDVSTKFGPEVAALVDGVTKLSMLKVREKASQSAENFRKLFLAMSKDIRVLLVKLADRLDNMRSLGYLADVKRRRIAIETAEIYAPLAERIGLRYVKEEMDDIAFDVLNHEARTSIVEHMNELLADDTGMPDRIMAELKDKLEEAGVKADLSGRVKSPYSIWNKMQNKAMTFDQLMDIIAFRAVVDDVPDCYQALGTLHSAYKMVPGRFKDYISTPKSNGYSSIHTGLIGPYRQKIEVQIRTRGMHEQAEKGVAAHWSYKQKANTEASESGEDAPNTDGKQFAWVRELLEILDNAGSPEEFLEHTKLEMYQDQVFTFTPKGGLIVLPKGACIVDFAYAVHSDIGNKCVGGKVNDRIRPLSHLLENGDRVEIMTSKTGEPRPDWESFCATGKAKAQVRRFSRIKAREQYGSLGQQMVHKAFRSEDLDYTEAALAAAAKKLGNLALEDLYVAVALGNQTIRPIIEVVHPGVSSKQSSKVTALAPGKIGRANKEEAIKRDHTVPIKGLLPGLAVHMARCCHPIPGDPIVGLITTGKGVTIHTRDCDNLMNYQDQPERWLGVSWDIDDQEERFVTRLAVVITNEPGSLGTLTTLIGKNHGNVTNLKFTNRSHDFFDLVVDVEVQNVSQMNNVIASLRASRYVSMVERKKR